VAKRRRVRERVLNEPIDKPIKVFVSSAQDEFPLLRQDLKRQIDSLKLGSRPVFRATLVEKKRGELIPADIDSGLDTGSIYVVMVGKTDTDWTIDEFDEARIRALPILIYDCRGLTNARGQGNLARKIDRLKRKGVRIQPDEYDDEQDFINHVLTDLPEKLGDIAELYLMVRKTVVRKQRFVTLDRL
jgi:hypothetical protein